MVFSSAVFLWLFLPVVLICYFISPKKIKNILLLLASLLFYAWGEPKYVILMVFSIAVNYISGLLIDKADGNKRLRLFLLTSSLSVSLLMLCYFKYFDFLIFNINRFFTTSFTLHDLALPIGISFFTFQGMSYVIDVYRRDVKVQKNIFNLALYISFFPQLIAGPIVKYYDIEQQLKNRVVTWEKFHSGICRFVFGLGKKMILANTLGATADAVFSLEAGYLSPSIAWIGIICYTLQIYYDFSGYSDMAIGLGRMFGFEFKENFNYPYISHSIKDFWRRWHISLSTWFKEYLYIPLGGNRKGVRRTYFNLIIVFFLTGLWHGAGWTFIFWGLWHGLFQIIERLGLGRFMDRHKAIGVVYALGVVVIGWVFFRSPSITYAVMYIKYMFVPNPDAYIHFSYYLTNYTVFILLLAVLLSGPLQCLYSHWGEKYSIAESGVYQVGKVLLIVIILIYVTMLLASNAYNPFIYFRF